MAYRSIEDVLAKAPIAEGSSCREWGLHVSGEGYGHAWHEGRCQQAHRVSYALGVGPIPDGMTVDHLCFNTRCVNPDHLRLLPPRENAGNQPRWRRDHCGRGHEYTAENTYRPPGRTGRHCRACGRERARQYKSRKGKS